MNKDIPGTYALILGLGLGRSKYSHSSASDFPEVCVHISQISVFLSIEWNYRTNLCVCVCVCVCVCIYISDKHDKAIYIYIYIVVSRTTTSDLLIFCHTKQMQIKSRNSGARLPQGTEWPALPGLPGSVLVSALKSPMSQANPSPGEIGKVGHPTGSPAGLPFTVYVTLGKLIKLLVSQLPQSSEQDYK